MDREPIMQFFKYDHLPPEKQQHSKPFGELAELIHSTLPRNPERSVALRKLLEAKDAAVRAGFMVLMALIVFLPSMAFAADVVVPPPQSKVLEIFLQYVVPPLLTIAAPFLIALMWKGIELLNTKGKESKVAAVVAPFAELAASVVANIDKTLRPQLLKALEDGVLTDAEKLQLRNEALRILKEQAPAGLLKSAQGIFGPLLDNWLSGLIERSVTERRAVEARGEPAAVTVNAVPQTA